MILKTKFKHIFSILLILTLIFNLSSTTVQGTGIFDLFNKELMFFEGGECELGRFSVLSVFAYILDKPEITGNRIYTTSVLFRVLGVCLQTVFGSTVANNILISTFSFQEPFRVYEKNGLYYQIEYMGKKGYILKTSVELIETQQVAMTTPRHDIYAGQSKPLSLKDETDFSKYVWSSSNSNVAYYDTANKKVIAKNAGTTTIMAIYGSKCAYCTVTVIKRWQQSFDAVATTEIALKGGASNSESNRFIIPSGTQISVRGNVGKWLYVKCVYRQVDYYGYVHYNGSNLTTATSDSTKGDMIYYATLGWRFPVKDTSYNYISSPYGPRGVNPPRHVGIDIVGKFSGIVDKPGYIYNKEVVAACSGTVKDVNWNSSTGNFVSITTDCTDPITKNKLVTVYMHLDRVSNLSNGDKIEVGETIGFAGNTGNSSGAHLHFDVNNENRAYSNSQSGYAYKHSINPIYFFISQNVILQPCSSPNGLYWPGIQ